MANMTVRPYNNQNVKSSIELSAFLDHGHKQSRMQLEHDPSF